MRVMMLVEVKEKRQKMEGGARVGGEDKQTDGHSDKSGCGKKHLNLWTGWFVGWTNTPTGSCLLTPLRPLHQSIALTWLPPPPPPPCVQRACSTPGDWCSGLNDLPLKSTTSWHVWTYLPLCVHLHSISGHQLLNKTCEASPLPLTDWPSWMSAVITRSVCMNCPVHVRRPGRRPRAKNQPVRAAPGFYVWK